MGIAVDSPIPDDVMDAISAAAKLREAKLIVLED
jgi:hypothetical protein